MLHPADEGQQARNSCTGLRIFSLGSHTLLFMYMNTTICLHTAIFGEDVAFGSVFHCSAVFSSDGLALRLLGITDFTIRVAVSNSVNEQCIHVTFF